MARNVGLWTNWFITVAGATEPEEYLCVGATSGTASFEACPFIQLVRKTGISLAPTVSATLP